MKQRRRVLSRINLRQRSLFNLLLVVSGLGFSLYILGCQENKAVECQQIFQIARNVVENNPDVSSKKPQLPSATKNWLQVASDLNAAASNLQALEINNSILIQYQHQLASIYQIYAQATYDAVRANENKNLEALEIARNDAIEAGQIQQGLIQSINTYCLD